MRGRNRRKTAVRSVPPPRGLAVLSLLVAAALVSACGGGGDVGSTRAVTVSTGMMGSPPTGPPPPSPPQCIQTHSSGCLTPTEYDDRVATLAAGHGAADGFSNQWGLATIRADRAYARFELTHGAAAEPGSGEIVGALDTGIHTGHPAFDGAAVYEVFLPGAGDEASDRFSHGTAVASVMAARRPTATDAADPARVPHGVAWGADVAMFAVPTGSAAPYFYRPVSPSGLESVDDRWTNRVNTVIGWTEPGAGRRLDFINVSLGFDGIIDQYDAAELGRSLDGTIAALAQRGRTRKSVFVWAAGNAQGRPCLPGDFPSGSGLCTNLQRLLYLCVGTFQNGMCDGTVYRDIDIGSVNAGSVEILAGLVARFSELQGHVLAVVAVSPPGSPGEQARIASFSNRCGSAADWCLAAPGTNVRIATGDDAFSTGSGTSYAAPMVTGALAAMKHYFRSQLSNTALVSRLLATADKSGAYANRALYGQGLLDLDAALAPVGTTSVALGAGVGGPGSHLAETHLAPGSAFGDGPGQALAGQEIAAFDELGAPFWYRLGGFARAAPRPSAQATLDAFMAPEPWMMLHPDPLGLALSPVAATAGMATGEPPSLLGGFAPAGGSVGREGPGFGFVDTPAPGLGGGHLSLARRGFAFDAEAPGGLGLTAFSTEGLRGRAPASGALVSWGLAPDRPGAAAGRSLRVAGGLVAERETMLGSRSAGAFGRLSSGSAFFGFEGGMQAGAWRLDAGAELGLASARADGGLLTGLSPLVSSAFALRAERALDAGSALRVSVSQPLRVESGRARLSVPVGRTPDGRVLRHALTADLEPSGRQIDLSARWRKRLTSGGELRLGATWTLQPGHDAAAPAELAVLAGWRHRF